MIARRLFVFNVLVVFTPVLGILYLDVYEAHLRHAQEDSMVQQARMLAAAIGTEPGEPAIDPDRLAALFTNLGGRSDARLRVYDRSGALVGDSARASPGTPEVAKYGPDARDTRRRLLYRLGASFANAARAAIGMVRYWLRPPKTSAGRADAAPDPEVRAALAGRYGSAIRATPGQRSMTLYGAVPVRRDGAVIGAVVASQSTVRLLRALYDVRLRVFEIVLASLFVAALLTAVAARTIVRPLGALERQASQLAARRGRSPGRFAASDRTDELGALARALEELTRRTNDHIELLQSFSADVSHELKNPLASIRTAAEMMATAGSQAERTRFLELMTRDVARLERLVSSLRDVALVERQIAQDEIERVDLRDVLVQVIEQVRGRSALPLDWHPPAGSVVVRASRERLVQVFDNVIANALSFAPAGTAVDVRIDQAGAGWRITVDDCGPGIPESHIDRIFDRFFSYRPAERRGDHVGLGLAIARQIVESYGGSIAASNRDEGGARFEVRLPRG